MALAFWRRAQTDPGWTALVEPDGTQRTAGELLARVNQLTHALRGTGLRPGDGIAVLLPNGGAALEIYLAALQGGWYYTPINWHFTPPEIAYIVADSDAKAFFVHERHGAAGVAAAVALGVVQSSTQHRLDQAQAENRSVAAVLAAPDARLAVHRTTAGGVATVVASPSRHAMIISTAGLPALSGGKVYELWFVSGGTARRAGLLPAPASGRTAPLLASGLAAGDAVALTVEPAGGTSQPTTKPIVVMAL